MKLTIAIPTHNRAKTLGLTLESLRGLELDPAFEAECLVIDNNSVDTTPAVVDEFADAAPFAVRRITEPQQGSSFARNRAVREARGELILFIDDDVIVEASWAAELIAEMKRRCLDVVCGIVLPRWQAPLPPWMGVELYGKLAIHHVESGINPPERLSQFFSANVGFRRDCFDRFGAFREDLGVVGGNPMSGEDTELFDRIIRNGGNIGLAPRAVVHHLIGPERLTRSYFRHKSFAYGVGSALGGGRTHNHLDKLAKNLFRMAHAVAQGDRPRAFYHQLECVNFLGYWYARLKLLHGSGPTG